MAGTYPKGVKGFPKHEKQPDWVVGKLIIEPRTPTDWLSTEEGRAALKDYNGTKQLTLQISKSKDGKFLNFQVDTYEKGQSNNASSAPAQNNNAASGSQERYVDESDLPF